MLIDPSNQLIFFFFSGRETVYHLAKHGAKVYLAARNKAKATTVIEEIKKDIPNAQIEFVHMDHMDLETVRKAAEEFKSKETQLHLLINNAGVSNIILYQIN
jgi:short-subunit dehydrogenase